MDGKIIPELEKIVETLQERISINLKLIESRIMELLKVHINKNHLERKIGNTKETLFQIKNQLRTYRPSPLIQNPTEQDKLNQAIIITFFLEIILIETNLMIELSQNKNIDLQEEILNLLKGLNVSLLRIKMLINHLLNFDKLVKRDDIYDDIWNNIQNLYSDPSEVKELLISCKKLNLYSIEKKILTNFEKRNYSIALSVLTKGKNSLEYSKDPSLLLEFVDPEGVDSKESLMRKSKWSEARVENTLQFLIKKGICKESSDSIKGKKYYFPGLKNNLK